MLFGNLKLNSKNSLDTGFIYFHKKCIRGQWITAEVSAAALNRPSDATFTLSSGFRLCKRIFFLLIKKFVKKDLATRRYGQDACTTRVKVNLNFISIDFPCLYTYICIHLLPRNSFISCEIVHGILPLNRTRQSHTLHSYIPSHHFINFL